MNVLIGEKSVIDIDTSMGDGAQLGHASCLPSSQTVPAGQRWHGSPAQHTDVDYRSADSARCGALRRASFGAVQLLNAMIFSGLASSVLFGYLPTLPLVAEAMSSEQTIIGSWAFYVAALAASFVLFFGGLLGGLVFVLTVPRAMNRALTTDRVYSSVSYTHLTLPTKRIV